MKTKKRANDLEGKAWARNSISIWSDIRKTSEETALRHPAIFPTALAKRLIECFTTVEERVVLDPFAGIGSTLLAASQLGGRAIGVELSAEFVALARSRLAETNGAGGEAELHCADARMLYKFTQSDSVDFVVTSPPYWNILQQRRTADRKSKRDYGKEEADLGKIDDYMTFLARLKEVFAGVYTALKPGKYCCVIVMDLRKKDAFYPLHSDLVEQLKELGFIFDDLIIWDRRQEYNNLRPLGYPSVFRINKTHEYILILRKPKDRDKD